MAAQVDFTGQEYLRNPAAGIARLRASGPVVEVRLPLIGRIWMTTTQALADRVLKDSETFTLRKNGDVAGMRWSVPGMFRVLANNMLTLDEPDHTRLRGIVDEAFRRRAVLEMEPRILAIAESISTGLLNPNLWIELAIWAICRFECWRALRGKDLSCAIGSTSIEG